MVAHSAGVGKARLASTGSVIEAATHGTPVPDAVKVPM